MPNKQVIHCDPEILFRLQSSSELCNRADALLSRIEAVWRTPPQEFNGPIPVPSDIQRLIQRAIQTGFTREAIARMMRE